MASDQGLHCSQLIQQILNKSPGNKLDLLKLKKKNSVVRSKGVPIFRVSRAFYRLFSQILIICLTCFRTARGDNKGTALSFVSVKEMRLLEEVEKELSGSSEGGESLFKPYQFRMEEIEGFRYRAKVCNIAPCTPVCVKQCKDLQYVSLFSCLCQTGQRSTICLLILLSVSNRAKVCNMSLYTPICVKQGKGL